MLKDKTIISLLLLYIFSQAGSLAFGGLLFVYIVVYLLAIIYSVITISKTVLQDGRLKPVVSSLVLFFAANLILLLIYLPTLAYNPEINWKLKGEYEQDPKILQAYFPAVFFGFYFIIVLVTVIVTRSIFLYKENAKRN